MGSLRTIASARARPGCMGAAGALASGNEECREALPFLEGVAKSGVVARPKSLRQIASAPGATDRAALAVRRPRERGRKPRDAQDLRPQ